MKKLVLLFFFFLCSTVFAANLPDKDLDIINAARIHLYDEAIFVYGNKDVDYRFASKEVPGNVQQWHREQLPQWSLFNQYGSWILYDGKPDSGMAGDNVYKPGEHSIQ